jgi:hypothetical protein
MVENKAPECLTKYTAQSEEELNAIIKRFPFFTMPKMALLIKRGTEDHALLNHVALTSYDRTKLEEHVKNREFFLKEK